MSADLGTALSQNDATDPSRTSATSKVLQPRRLQSVRLGRYNCRILIFGVGMQQREFSLGRPAANSEGWDHLLDRRHVVAPILR
jgi:hypothetical protein